MKAPAPTEDQLQIFANDLLDALALPGAYWHHSPNGGWRHIATAKKMKKFGTKAGFPDLILMPPLQSVAYLELKVPKGHLSDSQKEFRDMIQNRDEVYKVARSTTEIRNVLIELGMIAKETL